MEVFETRNRVIKPGTEKWLAFSKTNQLAYKIYVSKPKEPAPPSGYPVIYVLDGNAFFQTFQEVVRLQSKRSEKTGIPPAVVVGIGYPEDGDFVSTRRVYDFTPPASSIDLPPKPDGTPWPESGGANFFLQFIQEELISEINRRYLIDQSRQTLFGHSLGGLFTLYALFTIPQVFQTYIATSPSIWWNNRSIYEQERQFLLELPKMNRKIGIYLAVGSNEKDFMLEEAKELSERLQRLNNPMMNVEFQQSDEENHISVVPTVLSRALRFVFKKD